jgi:hypothetical protein
MRGGETELDAVLLRGVLCVVVDGEASAAQVLELAFAALARPARAALEHVPDAPRDVHASGPETDPAFLRAARRSPSCAWKNCRAGIDLRTDLGEAQLGSLLWTLQRSVVTVETVNWAQALAIDGGSALSAAVPRVRSMSRTRPRETIVPTLFWSRLSGLIYVALA